MTGISEFFRYKIAEERRRNIDLEVLDEVSKLPIWPVWHRLCGDIAFFMRVDPRMVSSINAKDVRLFNRKRPDAHSPMVCESCGKTIKKYDLLADPPVKTFIYTGETRH